MSKKDAKLELKRLMREEKAKRIESPLAKYNLIGQLMCVICNQVIKSELFWSAHLNSKSHLQQIEALKTSSNKPKPKIDDNVSFKRPHPMSNSETNDFKKAKIENAQSKENEDDVDDEELVNKAEKMEINKPIATLEGGEMETLSEVATVNKNELPQGFFDDKKKDMEARNVNYNAVLDSEFAKFKAELQNEETKNEIIAEIDDEVRDTDRDLEEVDQLIEKWSRVENLHQRKKNLAKLRANKNVDKKMEEDSSDESDVDLDSVVNLTLRTKNRC